MKFTAKLVSFLFVGIVILLAIDGYISIHREIVLRETDMKRSARLLGLAMKGLVEDRWHTKGQERAMNIIEEANEEEKQIEIRWVWLDGLGDDRYRPLARPEKLAPVAQGKELCLQERDDQGNGYLCCYVPLTIPGERLGALELSEPLTHLYEYARSFVIRVAVLIGAVMLVSGLVIVLMGITMIGQPLSQLVEKIRRIGEGDLSGPVHISTSDEFFEFGEALNRMCEELAEANEKLRTETNARIAALEGLRHEDRLRTVGILASGVAHELGTPLNVVSGRAGMIVKEHLSIAEIKENANIIKKQSERMTTIIRQLLNFARRPSAEKTLVDLRQIAVETLDLMATLAKKKKANLGFVAEEAPIMLNVDAIQIQQVLSNLVANALQASIEGGRVEVGIRCEHASPSPSHEGSGGEYICIYVQDEGKGISKEEMRHLFEPFFTTKTVGDGTGLGLSIAFGIVREHGGWIDVKSMPGKGSCFSVYLPKEINE